MAGLAHVGISLTVIPLGSSSSQVDLMSSFWLTSPNLHQLVIKQALTNFGFFNKHEESFLRGALNSLEKRIT